jgi:hypothetical protein
VAIKLNKTSIALDLKPSANPKGKNGTRSKGHKKIPKKLVAISV